MSYTREELEDLALTDKDDTWQDLVRLFVKVAVGALVIVVVALGYAMHANLI